MTQKKKAKLPEEIVMERIHYIRNQKVILDTDLAEMYGVTARRLREQVKRNRDRFPKHFMFQLTENELEKCRKMRHLGSMRTGGHHPYAFTRIPDSRSKNLKVKSQNFLKHNF